MGEIVISGLRKAFTDPSGRRVEVLKGIDLKIERGECFSLLGPSGCGKSTLLRILSGLERPDNGTISMDGSDVTDWPPERRPTAMVFQSYALFPHLSVEGNVAFGLKVRGISKNQIKKRVDEALDHVQLAGLHARRMDELSGGQQQRVALARVLAVEPPIILMDEPLSNLDAALRRSTRSAIRRLQTDLGFTLVYVTHDQEEALMISDRIGLLMDGNLIQCATPKALYETPATLDAARFIGRRNLIPVFISEITEKSVLVRLSENASSSHPPLPISPLSRPENLKSGDPTWLALRPDEIEIISRNSQSSVRATWQAEIELAAFAGSQWEIEARLLDSPAPHSLGFLMPVETNVIPRKGDKISLAPLANGGLLFPRHQS